MIEDNLLNYGMAGIFISYLIYDRQVILKGVKDSIDELRKAIIELKIK